MTPKAIPCEAGAACWLLLMLCSAGQAQTWTLADMPNLESAGWSAPREVDGRKVRLARAGQTAVLTVPAWWGEGFRPPEGKVWILRVHYREGDAKAKPCVALSHAGVASYWGMSELHRFGGDGRNQWQTDDVPVSWDLICRLPGSTGILPAAAGETPVPPTAGTAVPRSQTRIAFRAERDLPIEKIELLAPDADAAGRYFAETRNWIAAAQRQRLILAVQQQATMPSTQAASGPSAKLSGEMVVFPWSWQIPLMPDYRPSGADAGKPVRIRMAQNEFEPAAFGAYANSRYGLSGVEYDVTELKNEAGQALACELDLRTAEYAVVQEIVDYGAGADSGRYKLFPQRLWPRHDVHIVGGHSHLFWITVRTLGQASKPGLYRGRIRIRSRHFTITEADPPHRDVGGSLGAEAELPIQVEVLPVMLPSLEECGIGLGTCTSGLPTFQEVKTLVEHNHDGLDIWFGGTQPGMKVASGKLTLDWTYLDDWMAGARRLGINHIVWFLGGDPFGFPDTLNLERDLYRSQTGRGGDDLRREFIRRCNEKPEQVLPELRPLYADFVRQLAAHANEKNWPRLVLHPFDEPAKYTSTKAWDNRFEKVIGAGPWIKPHFQDACRIIRQASREVQTGLEAHVVEPCMVYLDDVDVFCTNRAYTLPNLAERLREKNVEFWQYANCDDQAYAHRNRYSFGFYFESFGSRGGLIWAYNALPRFDTSGGTSWGYGWATPFGTVYGPAMVGFREGMDDRRWVAAWRRSTGILPVSSTGVSPVSGTGVSPASRAAGTAATRDPPELAELLRQVQAHRAKTKYDSHNEADDPARMHDWRRQVQDAVVRPGHP